MLADLWKAAMRLIGSRVALEKEFDVQNIQSAALTIQRFTPSHILRIEIGYVTSESSSHDHDHLHYS